MGLTVAVCKTGVPEGLGTEILAAADGVEMNAKRKSALRIGRSLIFDLIRFTYLHENRRSHI
jgi:hypothetical protein